MLIEKNIVIQTFWDKLYADNLFVTTLAAILKSFTLAAPENVWCHELVITCLSRKMALNASLHFLGNLSRN